LSDSFGEKKMSVIGIVLFGMSVLCILGIIFYGSRKIDEEITSKDYIKIGGLGLLSLILGYLSYIVSY
jgi:hypothetical protein